MRLKRNAWRWLFAVFGIAAIVFMIHHEGAQELWVAIRRLAVWLPLICALELLRVWCDSENTYQALGECKSSISRTEMFRAQLISTAIGSIVPAGRSTEEASKGALISSKVGASSAASAAVISQVATFMGGGLITIPSAWVAWGRVGLKSILTLGLLLHTAVLLGLGVILWRLAKSDHLVGWLTKKFPRFKRELSDFKELTASTSMIILAPSVLMFSSRLLQTLQLLILLGAVNHQVSVSTALLAEGVFMLSLVAGAFIPGEFGASEGAFLLFSRALHTGRAKALSVALLLHSVKLVLILIGSLTPVFWKASEEPENALLSNKKRHAPRTKHAS